MASFTRSIAPAAAPAARTDAPATRTCRDSAKGQWMAQPNAKGRTPTLSAVQKAITLCGASITAREVSALEKGVWVLTREEGWGIVGRTNDESSLKRALKDNNAGHALEHLRALIKLAKGRKGSAANAREFGVEIGTNAPAPKPAPAHVEAPKSKGKGKKTNAHVEAPNANADALNDCLRALTQAAAAISALIAK